MDYKTQILLDGLLFLEGPRWHEGKLWFSDMHAHWVMNVDMKGNAQKVVEVPGQPSGLGWLPDGRLLIVSMTDRRLLRWDGKNLVEAADLSRLASFHCNDMVVDVRGNAYVGNFGSDWVGRTPAPANIIMVKPDGAARIVADKMEFPNGSVITPDGRTFIVAETFGRRLTAFDIDRDGSLFNRRVWADVNPAMPDGICLDAENAIWIANTSGNEVIRIAEGGKVLDRIKFAQSAYACALGGKDNKTLFVLTAKSSVPEAVKSKPTARIEYVGVPVPGV
jgi:sugar lactone lactonase YvrE